MTGLFLVPALVQMLAMLVDEGWFHRRRGLPRWERIGHPIDTLTVAICYAWLVATRPGDPHALSIYLGLSLFSCLCITKDEFVHARVCDAAEGWLHAILFVLHPLVFASFGIVWWLGADLWVVRAQLGLTLAFGVYQFLYWSVSWNRRSKISAR